MCEGKVKKEENITAYLQWARERTPGGGGLGAVGGENEPLTEEQLRQVGLGQSELTAPSSQSVFRQGYNPAAFVQWLREHRDQQYPR